MLIKCPECNREISDKATVCIHCGFPINPENKNESTHLQEKTQPNYFYAYCPRCLDNCIVDANLIDCDSIVCENCHNTKNPSFKTINYKVTEYKLNENKTDFINLLKRLNHIQEKNIYDEQSFKFRVRIFKFNLFEQTEKKITEDIKYLNTPFQQIQSVPHCPICGHTNLEKISTADKATKIGLFGIFGAGDLGKTWKCNNCGTKF